jgi:alanine dehydrogenase
VNTTFLSGKEIASLLDMKEVIRAVEDAFLNLASGKAKMPPKIYLSLDEGDFRAMPAAIPGAAGVKWVNVHPHNPEQGLPTVMATLIYNDPATGYPLAVMDASLMTAYRTGAASAIASKYLARKNISSLGLIGAGRQAVTQYLAHMELFDIKIVKVFDSSGKAIEKFIDLFPQYPVEASSLEEAAACDIVCTVTPSREPFLKPEWIMPGTHINAVGADAPGKEELYPELLRQAKVVVDDLEQAQHSGEINVPIKNGLYQTDNIYATLAEIVSGKRAGRASDGEITIFDSTGVAVEDIAVAKLLYEKTKISNDYLTLDFIG